MGKGGTRLGRRPPKIGREPPKRIPAAQGPKSGRLTSPASFCQLDVANLSPGPKFIKRGLCLLSTAV